MRLITQNSTTSCSGCDRYHIPDHNKYDAWKVNKQTKNHNLFAHRCLLSTDGHVDRHPASIPSPCAGLAGSSDASPPASLMWVTVPLGPDREEISCPRSSSVSRGLRWVSSRKSGNAIDLTVSGFMLPFSARMLMRKRDMIIAGMLDGVRGECLKRKRGVTFIAYMGLPYTVMTAKAAFCYV